VPTPAGLGSRRAAVYAALIGNIETQHSLSTS
jgi:hypothetical protein